jgi:AraC-like DNA-binding protein
VPDGEAALLQARCRCHGANRGEVDMPGALRSHVGEPRLAARLVRPLLEHVRQAWLARKIARYDRARGEGNLFDPFADLASDERVPLALADAWLVEASGRLDDPSLGLAAVRNLVRGDGDALELAAESAPTLDAALATLIRHAGLLCDVAELHLYVEQGSAALELRYAVNLSHVLRDFLLGALAHALSRWLDSLVGFEVWLAEPLLAARSSYAAAFAPAAVKLGSRCDALVFPAARLAERPRTADAALHEVLLRVLERSGTANPGLVPLSARVRHVLGPRLSTADGNVEGVARSLGLSPRSLARKLQDEGVTFSELLENMRRERAIHYVERSNLAPQQIAHLLGYSTTAAFCRAFSRWYGQSALRVRNAAQLSQHG